MLQYWLSVFQKGFNDSLDFIQQSRSGITFAVLILVLTGFWLWQKHGWRDAMTHFWRTVGEGAVITVVAWILVLLVHVVYEPFHLQYDERARTSQARADRDVATTRSLVCAADLTGEKGKTELLNRQVTAQQTQIAGQQGASATQQSTFDLCVTTLAKTNAPVQQKTTMLLLGDKEPSVQAKHSASVLLLTNRPVSITNLLIWCQNDVKGVSMSPFGEVAYSGGVDPVKTGIATDPKRWQVSMSFPEWSPDLPMLVKFYYDGDSLGQCFTRML